MRQPLPEPKGWCDFWHRHPDFFGWSRRSSADRHAHLRVLFECFERFLGATAEGFGPIQVFLTVYERDSAGNAIYVHTPNPNGSAFPHRFDSHEWDVPAPPWLVPYLVTRGYRVAAMDWEGDRAYSIVCPEREDALLKAGA